MPFFFDAFPTLRDTDLMYGLANVRMSYRKLEPFKIFSSRNNIDSYRITNKELSFKTDPESISYKNEDFIQYISDHEKYSSIQSDFSMKGPYGWVYEHESLVLGRKCKAGLGWASENDIHVNFVLDDIDMKQVVTKEKTVSFDLIGTKETSITSRELRYLYRNRNNEKISSNVQFWNKGKPVEPPWETDPDTWSLYKPKSEITGAQATTKAALEIQPSVTNPAAATATATAEEMTTIEELGLEML